MKWRKLGFIFTAQRHSDWMYSHAMIPIAQHLHGDRYRIYFSCRDKDNRGHGAYLEIDMARPTEVLALSDKPVLSPGELGAFDDSGALPNALLQIDGQWFLYYTGINVGHTVSIRNSIGLAKWNEQSQIFERQYRGPIIDRTRDLPHFVATPEVMCDNGIFKAWFTSCQYWRATADKPRHFYNLEYAESDDGINWRRRGETAIDFADEYEYALGVPRVLKSEDGYQMWFCSRATAEVDTYRIRYATSKDGRHWQRHANAGIDVSQSGWDSQMIGYPFVFDHGGERYMLYNGNDYGRDGFGIAKLARD